MPFIRGLTTAVKLSGLTYRLITSTTLIGYSLLALSTSIRNAKRRKLETK